MCMSYVFYELNVILCMFFYRFLYCTLNIIKGFRFCIGNSICNKKKY